jgi:hypothetical protein
MYWILLVMATGAPLGVYQTQLDCKVAVQHQMVIDMLTPASQGDPIMRLRAEELVAKKQRTQTDYACLQIVVDKR